MTSGASGGGQNPVEDTYVRGGTYADDDFGTASVIAISSNHMNYTKEEGVVSRGQEFVATNNTIFEIRPMSRVSNPYYTEDFKS